MLKTNIKESIREIQKNIIRIKKDKKMVVNMSIIIDLLVNDEWEQDLIEKIRDERGDK